jgi:hypothetical protein
MAHTGAAAAPAARKIKLKVLVRKKGLEPLRGLPAGT